MDYKKTIPKGVPAHIMIECFEVDESGREIAYDGTGYTNLQVFYKNGSGVVVEANIGNGELELINVYPLQLKLNIPKLVTDALDACKYFDFDTKCTKGAEEDFFFTRNEWYVEERIR